MRDKLVNGDIDASHVLYGLIYGLHLGVAGPKKEMALLMSLNHNGQAITLSKKLADAGVKLPARIVHVPFGLATAANAAVRFVGGEKFAAACGPACVVR